MRVVEHIGTYPTAVGSQMMKLPIVPLSEDLAIALLITVDHGVSFAERAGREIAEQLADLGVDIVASLATMGIPVAIEVTRSLGLDDYLILQKTQKIHLADAVDEPVKSITTGAMQRLLFDRARIGAVVGRRVALVDDVVSTGASVKSALALLRRVGAEPVAVAALLSEASLWRSTLGEDQHLVRALGSIPLFRRDSSKQWKEDWDGSGGESIEQADTLREPRATFL